MHCPDPQAQGGARDRPCRPVPIFAGDASCAPWRALHFHPTREMPGALLRGHHCRHPSMVPRAALADCHPLRQSLELKPDIRRGARHRQRSSSTRSHPVPSPLLARLFRRVDVRFALTHAGFSWTEFLPMAFKTPQKQVESTVAVLSEQKVNIRSTILFLL